MNSAPPRRGRRRAAVIFLSLIAIAGLVALFPALRASATDPQSETRPGGRETMVTVVRRDFVRAVRLSGLA